MMTNESSGIPKPRRHMSNIGIFGNSSLHHRHPLVIAWWSAALPGFGHLLLSKHLKGIILIIWEILVNYKMHLNEAMVYSFTGNIAHAIAVIDVEWMGLYAPVYLFAIYDCYRLTIDLNHLSTLAARENAPFPPFIINTLDINSLDKREPWVIFAWSCLMPGIGQFIIQRIIPAVLIMTCWIIFCYQSHFLLAFQYTMLGKFAEATQSVDPEWLLFMPSLYLFAIYDAYVHTVECNKLFEREQVGFLSKTYGSVASIVPHLLPGAAHEPNPENE